MKNPAALARVIALRIMDEAMPYLPVRSQVAKHGQIERIIEEELEGKIREDHHGPKQGNYVRRSLERQ